MKRVSWLLISILALSAALRLINLNGRPLWYDEAFAILYAEKSLGAILSGTLTPVQGAAADVHPVAFYFLLHGWMRLVGQSPLAVRMLSVLYGVGTVALVYRFMCDLFSERVGWWSALVVAVAPFQIAYSQEARMYAMLGFWSMAALAAFVRAWQWDSPGAWAAFVVCGALALYSHNLAFALFAALGAWVVARAIYSRPQPFSLRGRREHLSIPSGVEGRSLGLLFKTVLAGLVMLALFAPWLLRVPGQLGKIGQAYWVTRPGVTSLVQTFIAFTFDFENAVFPRLLMPLALFGTLLALVVVIWQLVHSFLRGHVNTRLTDKTSSLDVFGVKDSWGEHERPQLLLAVLAFMPVALVFIISQWIPVYIIRGLIPASIFYAALVGWALAAMPRPARVVFGLPLGTLGIAVLVVFYAYTGFPRGPYRELDAFLRAQLQSPGGALRPGDVIVHSNKLTFFPAHVYDRTLPQVFLGDPPGSGSDTLARPTQEALGLFPVDLESATAGKSRVWLVIFRQAIAEMKGNHPHVAWLSAHFSQTQTTTFGDMDVILFVRKDR